MYFIIFDNTYNTLKNLSDANSRTLKQITKKGSNTFIHLINHRTNHQTQKLILQISYQIDIPKDCIHAWHIYLHLVDFYGRVNLGLNIPFPWMRHGLYYLPATHETSQPPILGSPNTYWAQLQDHEAIMPLVPRIVGWIGYPPATAMDIYIGSYPPVSNSFFSIASKSVFFGSLEILGIVKICRLYRACISICFAWNII